MHGGSHHGAHSGEGDEDDQHGVGSIEHLSQGEGAMNLNAHRLWAGTLLVLTSFTPEGKRT